MSGFDWDSTTDDVLAGKDLTGKRVLVTGVSAGIGVETARALAAHGAEVIGAARNLEKAREATRAISEEFGDRFRLVELDLASLASVRSCADALLAEGKPFDIIIANAGIMAVPFARTVDGFESQIGTNHLGHFVLVNKLAPLIPAGGRVVCLSSQAHQMGDIDFDDMNFESREYDAISAYAAAKTANILFAVEFDRRHRDRGVRAAAVHPGGIATELTRYMDQDVLTKMTEMSLAEMDDVNAGYRIKTIPQGAATSVWAAVTASADEVGGKYCEDCHIAAIADKGIYSVRPYALDPERAKTSWARSQELVGEVFA